MNMTNKEYYLTTYREMLRAFLGWSEPQIREWIVDRVPLEELDDWQDIYYHVPPQYWMVNTLIPLSLHRSLSENELIDLRHRIFEAFNDEHLYEFPLGTDWSPFKEKVAEILKDYSARLPLAE